MFLLISMRALHQYYTDMIMMTLVLASNLNKKHFSLDSRAFFFELFTPCCVPFLLNLR